MPAGNRSIIDKKTQKPILTWPLGERFCLRGLCPGDLSVLHLSRGFSLEDFVRGDYNRGIMSADYV